MIEFAIVLILLITLLREIITYGLLLSAQATVTQAVADAARAGLVGSPSAVSIAQTHTAPDVGWMPRVGAGAARTLSGSIPRWRRATRSQSRQTTPCPSHSGVGATRWWGRAVVHRQADRQRHRPCGAVSR